VLPIAGGKPGPPELPERAVALRQRPTELHDRDKSRVGGGFIHSALRMPGSPVATVTDMRALKTGLAALQHIHNNCGV